MTVIVNCFCIRGRVTHKIFQATTVRITLLAPRLQSDLMKPTIWWSLNGSKLASGLLQAIMEFGWSFGLGLRLSVVLVQNHVAWFLHLRRAQKIHNDWKGLKMAKRFWKNILRLKLVNYFSKLNLLEKINPLND